MNWLRRMFKPPEQPAAEIVWTIQAPYHPFTAIPIKGYPWMHIGRSAEGTFEIYEYGKEFLLLFPRKWGMPAELFNDEAEAKDSAAKALRNASYQSHKTTDKRSE
jgi:hypothetical protein